MLHLSLIHDGGGLVFSHSP